MPSTYSLATDFFSIKVFDRWLQFVIKWGLNFTYHLHCWQCCQICFPFLFFQSFVPFHPCSASPILHLNCLQLILLHSPWYWSSSQVWNILCWPVFIDNRFNETLLEKHKIWVWQNIPVIIRVQYFFTRSYLRASSRGSPLSCRFSRFRSIFVGFSFLVVSQSSWVPWRSSRHFSTAVVWNWGTHSSFIFRDLLGL